MYFHFWFYSTVSLLTVVEGDPKAPFSIATTLRCWGEHFSFPWIAPLTFDQSLIPYSADCWTRRHQVPFLKSLVWTQLGIEPQSLRPLANILAILPIYIYIYIIYIYIYIYSHPQTDCFVVLQLFCVGRHMRYICILLYMPKIYSVFFPLWNVAVSTTSISLPSCRNICVVHISKETFLC